MWVLTEGEALAGTREGRECDQQPPDETGSGLVRAGEDLVRAAIAAGKHDPDPKGDLGEHKDCGKCSGWARPVPAQGEHEQRYCDRGDRVREHAVSDLQLGVTAPTRESTVAGRPLRSAGAVSVGGDYRGADGDESQAD